MSVAEISEAENLRLLRSELDAEQRADAERQRADAEHQRADRLQAEREDLAYMYERLFGRDALYLSVFPHGPTAPPPYGPPRCLNSWRKSMQIEQAIDKKLAPNCVDRLRSFVDDPANKTRPCISLTIPALTALCDFLFYLRLPLLGRPRMGD